MIILIHRVNFHFQTTSLDIETVRIRWFGTSDVADSVQLIKRFQVHDCCPWDLVETYRCSHSLTRPC